MRNGILLYVCLWKTYVYERITHIHSFTHWYILYSIGQAAAQAFAARVDKRSEEEFVALEGRKHQCPVVSWPGSLSGREAIQDSACEYRSIFVHPRRRADRARLFANFAHRHKFPLRLQAIWQESSRHSRGELVFGLYPQCVSAEVGDRKHVA